MSAAKNTVINSQAIYSGRIVTLRLDEVRIKDGTRALREVVEHEPCVVVVAYLEKTDEILFIEQYRDAVQSSLLELPAGIVHPGDRDALETAHRELREETGYEAQSMQPMGKYFTSPGFTNEQHNLFLATHLSRVSSGPTDTLEIDSCRPIRRKRVHEMIEQGAIVDGKSILAFYWSAQRIGRRF